MLPSQPAPASPASALGAAPVQKAICRHKRGLCFCEVCLRAMCPAPHSQSAMGAACLGDAAWGMPAPSALLCGGARCRCTRTGWRGCLRSRRTAKRAACAGTTAPSSAPGKALAPSQPYI